jgi:cyclopropane fatty-acyl-phospholipid synthase-like methyltransferase
MFVREKTRDPWFKRRIMRLTALEKRAVNCRNHAESSVATALEILENATLPDRPKCLELGCGQGALARLMVERFRARMTATDFDPAQLRLAESRLRDLGETVAFRIVDARDLPFGNEEFDVVFSFGVMHHIAGGWREVVGEVSRVLTSTGLFIFTDLYLPRWFAWGLERLFPRFDQLAFGPLNEVLEKSGLFIAYQAWTRHAAGAMIHGRTIARKAVRPTVRSP